MDVSDYAMVFRARWAGIPVTDLLNMPLYWVERIGEAMHAEAEAQRDGQAAAIAGKGGAPPPNPGHKPVGVVKNATRIGG